MKRYLTSRDSSRLYFEPSGPMPLSFMPPKGRDPIREALVDADNAVFEGLGNTPNATGVVVLETGGEAEVGAA
jgi:hypothetical protein